MDFFQRRKCVALDPVAIFNRAVPDKYYFPSAIDLAVQGTKQAAFHERATGVTRGRFGTSVFVRAVVEVSNFCRENCTYCGMRRDNRALKRVRARHESLAEMLIQHRPASVTDINIQAGEDPVAVREVVLPLIRALRRETSLGISVCLGTLPTELYAELQSAGASIYIIKFEIGGAAQYEQFAAPGTLAERLRHVRLLADAGWNVSSGFISGLPGQTVDDLIHNFKIASELPLNGCSVSPFIPGNETPLSDGQPGRSDWTLNSIAALRLMRPDWIIPAISALNLMESDGYRHGLRAGANLVTMNLTPEEVRGDYVIYKRDRFIMTEERVLDAIAAEGLQPSVGGLAEHYRHQAERQPQPRTALPV